MSSLSRGQTVAAALGKCPAPTVQYTRSRVRMPACRCVVPSTLSGQYTSYMPGFRLMLMVTVSPVASGSDLNSPSACALSTSNACSADPLLRIWNATGPAGIESCDNAIFHSLSVASTTDTPSSISASLVASPDCSVAGSASNSISRSLHAAVSTARLAATALIHRMIDLLSMCVTVLRSSNYQTGAHLSHWTVRP